MGPFYALEMVDLIYMYYVVIHYIIMYYKGNDDMGKRIEFYVLLKMEMQLEFINFQRDFIKFQCITMGMWIEGIYKGFFFG